MVIESKTALNKNDIEQLSAGFKKTEIIFKFSVPVLAVALLFSLYFKVIFLMILFIVLILLIAFGYFFHRKQIMSDLSTGIKYLIKGPISDMKINWGINHVYNTGGEPIYNVDRKNRTFTVTSKTITETRSFDKAPGEKEFNYTITIGARTINIEREYFLQLKPLDNIVIEITESGYVLRLNKIIR